MKERSNLVISFWSTSLGKSINARLKIDSESYVLWNYYFVEKKRSMHDSILEMIRMARERMNDKRHNEPFLLSLVRSYGSPQKAFDRIFELALERYFKLQRQGRVPVLLPHRVPSPRTEEIKAEERIEPKEITTPQTIKRLNEIKKSLAPSLKDQLTLEMDKETDNIILRPKSYMERSAWISIMTIVNNYKGRWDREKKIWIILQ